ncbi:MAG: FAD binding domain-containing protein [Pseudonocardia sp.]|nr:FAD binding domain-containing protein [Pseudonocardia sp.]MBO0872439.1 FAD binding domain-containing protein [Pseudonocardia sp.]
MKPPAFAYHDARDLHEATELLAELGEEAKLLAGGLSLVAMMNFRLAHPSALIDLGRVEGLSYLRREDGTLRIGALTTHHAVETGLDVLGDEFGVLARAACHLGHYPIRTRGTFGGSIAHCDPTAEWCLLAVLLDGRVVVTSAARGRRTIPADEFLRGYFSTALEPDEVVVEVIFPRPARHAALTEFARRRGDFALVAAAVDLEVADGRCRRGRVALGGVDVTAVRVPEAEAVLTDAAPGDDLWTEAADAAARAVEPGSDAHASAEYRRRLTRTLVHRALREAVAR